MHINTPKAVEDIGRVAAGVFEVHQLTASKKRTWLIFILQNPDDYRSQTLVVVGDILTMQEQEATYRALTGQSLTSIPKFLARFIIAMNNHTKGLYVSLSLYLNFLEKLVLMLWVFAMPPVSKISSYITRFA